jgi:hypothetical protein
LPANASFVAKAPNSSTTSMMVNECSTMELLLIPPCTGHWNRCQ